MRCGLTNTAPNSHSRTAVCGCAQVAKGKSCSPPLLFRVLHAIASQYDACDGVGRGVWRFFCSMHHASAARHTCNKMYSLQKQPRQNPVLAAERADTCVVKVPSLLRVCTTKGVMHTLFMCRLVHSLLLYPQLRASQARLTRNCDFLEIRIQPCVRVIHHASRAMAISLGRT